MSFSNYNEIMDLYISSNPSLSYEDLGNLLFIDNVYKEVPPDLNHFRDVYPHFDPSELKKDNNGMIFLDIARRGDGEKKAKLDLNSYLNIKYNYIGNKKTYGENMVAFSKYSFRADNFIEHILTMANIPSRVRDCLALSKDLAECQDAYKMLKLYRKKNNLRLKYEIMRRLGLIFMISSIRKTFLIDDVDRAISNLENAFRVGLGLKSMKKKEIYFWLDKDNKISFTDKKDIAKLRYERSMLDRKKEAQRIFGMQKAVLYPYRNLNGNTVLNIEVRNKLRKKGVISYDSFIEKMLRKDLEFPSQVHDVIGIKVVVENEKQVKNIVSDIESFLGGSSTRKKEKNTLNKFGKRKLSKFSSKEYFVWKAVYDVALPHPSIEKVQKMIEITKLNKDAQTELKSRLEYFMDRPQDVVVEVQIQALKSYLLSITKGSSTDHERLKMNQIRENSFYKIFPKEIYAKELAGLRKKILGKK